MLRQVYLVGDRAFVDYAGPTVPVIDRTTGASVTHQAEATSEAVGQWLAARRMGQPAPARGVYHMAPPDHTTWHGFASAIVDAMTLPEGRKRPQVKAITSAEYPAPAARPAWSVLDSRLLRETFGLELPPWRLQLSQCMERGGA